MPITIGQQNAKTASSLGATRQVQVIIRFGGKIIARSRIYNSANTMEKIERYALSQFKGAGIDVPQNAVVEGIVLGGDYHEAETAEQTNKRRKGNGKGGSKKKKGAAVAGVAVVKKEDEEAAAVEAPTAEGADVTIEQA